MAQFTNRKYVELQEAGQKARMKKLLENEHKDGFDDLSMLWCFDRAGTEYNIELRAEINEYIKNYKNMSPAEKLICLQKIDDEAADVGNFLDMIHYRLLKMKLELVEEHGVDLVNAVLELKEEDNKE